MFELFDQNKAGLIDIRDFRRCIKIFFRDIVPEGEKLEFVLNLTKKTVDTKVKYREFCKLLSKKFVKTFKLASKDADDFEGVGETKKSSTELALDRPLIKEASLNYIMRKAAELQIDLRKELMSHDPLDLSVISRVNFWGIMLSLPLGLNEAELTEVFENELSFDNNGNVDYMKILNDDTFVALERKRL